MNSIEQRIRTILHQDFKVRQESIGPDTTFADLGFDSLVIVELALVLDNELGITLEDGELADTMTIADACGLIMDKGLML